MSGSTTPNYGFGLPTIGGNQDSWGNILNSNWSSLDTLIHNLVVAAGGSSATSLPLTGGTLTGPLQVQSNLTVTGTTTLGGAVTLNGPETVNGKLTTHADLQVGGIAYFANSTDLAIYASGTQRIFQWGANVTTVYDTGANTWYWNWSTPRMWVTNGGNLTIVGAGYSAGGGPWISTSDDRVKRGIAPYEAGLSEVCRLQPITFQFTGQGDTPDDGKTYYGLSAQRTQTVMPELVVQLPPEPKRLAGQLGTQLGPLLLAACNAIRELRDRVVALEAHGA